MNSTPAFGPIIRGMRLGFHFSAKHQAFIRMSSEIPGRPDLCLVEIYPPHVKLPNGGPSNHRTWWDKPEILDALPWLRPVFNFHKAVRVIVDMDGEIVEPYGDCSKITSLPRTAC